MVFLLVYFPIIILIVIFSMNHVLLVPLTHFSSFVRFS